MQGPSLSPTSLSLLLPGSWPQAVLTQPPSESGSLGQRVTLSCTGSSSNIGGGNSVNWSQPLPGKAPRSVFTYANLMAIAAPDQISGFKSGSSGTLTITGLQPEDKADCDCLNWQSSASHCDTGRWGHERRISACQSLSIETLMI
uniref:Ig-like domain-containing protein n=1 Tax=Sus scrofa TaxID=9823 RepID=A0A8D1QYY3_PIG